MDFQGKVALVTGASVGIGRAVARKLAAGGAKLVLADLDDSGLEALKRELEEQGTDALIFACDVSDETRVSEIVRAGEEHFGRIDILVNNAALWRQFSLFSQTSVEDWKRMLDVNVMGTVYFTKAVLDGMVERGWGRVINVASVAGVYGNATMVPYSASKGAVISFTRALAKEVADKGVLVNCVSPGSVSPSQIDDDDYTEPSELSFMGRTGSDAENADLICFLASDAASYISGQNIQIDGCRKKQ